MLVWKFVDFQLKHPHALLDQFLNSIPEGLSEADAYFIESHTVCKWYLQDLVVAVCAFPFTFGWRTLFTFYQSATENLRPLDRHQLQPLQWGARIVQCFFRLARSFRNYFPSLARTPHFSGETHITRAVCRRLFTNSLLLGHSHTNESLLATLKYMGFCGIHAIL